MEVRGSVSAPHAENGGSAGKSTTPRNEEKELNDHHARGRRDTPHHVWTRYLVAVGAASLTLLSLGLRAYGATPPAVPPGLEVPAGHRLFLVGHASGTQNFVCTSVGGAFVWAFFGPQATLFDDRDGQLTTHFLSANPDEEGEPRPTWQHSRDTSRVWAVPRETSSDPAYVEPGAIAWLLLAVVGTEAGPNGGRRLAETTFIQRINTSGGLPPTTGCAQPSDVGRRKALVPYTADYFFYKPARRAPRSE